MADLPTLPTVTISAPALPSVSPPANFPYLRPASWKGVPFGVRGSRVTGGRKVAPHQYPYRDQQWPEDMGRKGRGLSFRGFLLDGGGQYGGKGSIESQLAQMVQACESAGPGYLVHPLLGQQQMQLADFSADQEDAPGLVELSFTFLESGKPLTPTIAADTQSQSTLSGFAAMAAAAQSWAIAVTEDVHTALGDAEITSTLQSFTSIANTVATTATSLVSMVGMLPGEYGRFVGQTVADAEKTATSVEELAGIGAAGREGVSSACAATLGAATDGDYASSALSQAATSAAAGSPQTTSTAVLAPSDVVDVATGVQAIVQAVLAANPDSAAQVQACIALAAFPATSQPSTEQAAVNSDVSALCRRMALAAAAQASAAYVPTSQQDAANLRDEIVTLIQDEMLIAGDAGDDTSYVALESLLSAVAADLAARGASLPQSVQVTFAGSLPSLVLAQRLYQDLSRSDELVQEANPISPLFMPQSFQALAS